MVTFTNKDVKTTGQSTTTIAAKDKSDLTPKPITQSKSLNSSPIGTANITRSTGNLKHIDSHVRPASAISDMANQKSSSPKHVQISDIVSVNITDASTPCTPTVINPCLDKPNGILKRDNSLKAGRSLAPYQSQLQTSFVAGDDQKFKGNTRSSLSPLPPSPPSPSPPENSTVSEAKETLNVRTIVPGPNSPQTSSSESPEWPSPPEPLTPQTPLTPNGPDQLTFDSDTIQKMLRSLPSSPIDKNFSDDIDLGFHEDCDASGDSNNQTPQQPSVNGRRGSRLSRTKSLNFHDRNTKSNSNPRERQESLDTLADPVTYHKVDAPRPRMFNKIALERELKKRNKNIAASYPDSGIGMSSDNVPSSRSEGNSLFIKTGMYLWCFVVAAPSPYFANSVFETVSC